MKHRILAAALLLPAVAFAQLPTKEPAKPAASKPAAKPAAGGEGPVAVVNGVAIPRQRLEAVIRIQLARGAQDSEQLRAQAREVLIGHELLLQEATRSGFSKTPEVVQLI